MSDELIFDSERQERRAKKKRRMIPLLVLAGILIAVIVVVLIVRSGKTPVHPAGEDTAYPYTWQAQRDGSLVLEISHADAPDFRWTLTNPDALVLVEASREVKEDNNTTRFTLKPLAAGRDMVELRLMREQESVTPPSSKEEALELSYNGPGPEDVLFKLTLLVEFTEEEDKLTGTVLSSSGVRCQGVQSGGANSANPYQIYCKNERNLVTAVKIASDEKDWTWEILSGEDSVVFEGLVYDVGEVQLFLRAGQAPGECEVVLRSKAAEAEIRLHCVRTEDGSLLVKEHQAQLREKSEEPPAQETEEESEAARAEAATVAHKDAAGTSERTTEESEELTEEIAEPTEKTSESTTESENAP